MRILAINPGATSTKVAVFDDEKPLFTETIRHDADEIKKFEHTYDQYDFRANTIRDALKKHDMDIASLDAVVGRGGTFKPLKSGTYEVNEAIKDDVIHERVQSDHISLIGCLLADDIAKPLGIKAYIVDPVSVDEFDDICHISGLDEVPRLALAHALNVKMIAKRFAREQKKKYSDLRLIVVHLGGGITVSAHRDGRMFDASNANDDGPFSPQRTGSLPLTGLIKLCYSGKYTKNELLKKVLKQGGMINLLGTDDLQQICEKAKTDEKFDMVLRAFAYQISKEIGAYSTTLKGKVDAILLTGGVAFNDDLMDQIKEYIDWIAPVNVYPGEDEMEALVKGVLRVTRGEEEVVVYK